MIPLLLKPKILALRNRLRRASPTLSTRARDWTILVFGVCIMVGIFAGSSRALWFAEQRRHMAFIPAHIPLGMFFLFLFGMLLFSCAVSAFGALFLSRDLDLILSSPLRRGAFFWGKFSEVIFSASWMAVIFGLPAIAAFGYSYRVGVEFYLVALAAALPFFAIPAASAMIVVTIFTRIVPLTRTRELLILAIGIFLYIVYQAIHLFAPAQSAGGGLNNILRLLATVSAPHRDWMPSYWISQALSALLEPGARDASIYLILSYAVATSLIALAYITIELLHFEAFSKSRSLTQARSRNSAAAQRLIVKILAPLNQRLRALCVKEYRTFARDITQTVQVLLLLGICVIYLYNFSLVRSVEDFPPEVRGWWRAFLLVMNLSMGDFVITAACTRFVFPSVSLEGPSYWVLQTSPLSLRELLRAKFLSWFVPIALVSGLVFSTGAWALRGGPAIVAITVLSSIIVCYGIVSLAVGLGAVFANFEWEHASQLAASFGSLVFMFVSTFLIALNVIPTVALIFVRDSALSRPYGELEWGLWVIAHIALITYINVKVARLAFAAGERALLRRMM